MTEADADLIAAVRGGDVDAYGALFVRHVDSARRLARSLSSDGEADDLVSEAFAKVLVVLQRGEGPDTALRPYLLTALRRLHVDRVRSLARTRPTDDIAAYDAGVELVDTAVAGFESSAAARAFASLPERWQLVLWHVEVEGQKPAEIAPLLGISPNSVSALAYRAREGLRQAFVAMHAQEAEDARCAATRAQLGAFIRDDISKRDSAAVQTHLRSCRECAGIYLELVEVNSDLRALIAPIILGGAAAAYLGGSAAGGGVGFLGMLTGLVSGRVPSNVARSLAGTAAVGALVAAVVVGVHLGGTDEVRVPPAAGDKMPAAVDPTPDRGARRSDDRADPPEPTPSSTHRATTETVTPAVESSHPDRPTHEPTHEPTDEPTDEPRPPSRVSVASSAHATGGLLWQVTVRITGLAPTDEGTVTVTLDRPAVGLHLDPRCDLVSRGRLTCRVSGPGSIQLLVTPVPGVPTTLTAALAPGDHRSSVRLG